ncbi:hypothetical protein FD754_015228 [Muntiacus muntjak]|uniref:Fibronectin type-II domain-containing protein n=1 Tax=Muntiacus muntjak TaxID=9888 RepID=A0A5N3VM96_MUNMU|nr:hypothetical protein FD754_015228 [Muntiacus muntjak]
MALRLELFLIWAGVSMFLQLEPWYSLDSSHLTLTLLCSCSSSVHPPAPTFHPNRRLSDGYFILPKVKEGTASGAETKDDNCVFPFIYGNIKYFDCTYQGSIFPWCSLDADYRGRWKYCTNQDYAKCVFPFIYEGKSYDTCTVIGSFTSTYWCSLSPNYDQDRVWKYC